MKKYLISGMMLISTYFLNAHPGIGIVKDSKGNIFYTDLTHIWKIEPGGNKTIVVRNVHSHEIFIDQQDNLYGEHLWYNGEKANTWGHYAWCLKNNGELVKEESTSGFLDGYSFVRDSSGNMYWVEKFTVTRFKKKTKDGKISTIAEGKFGFIGWLYSTAAGTIYFTAGNKLYKLSQDGLFTVLAKDIGSKTTDFTVMGRNYDSYGIWTDEKDNIYLAMIDAKKVIQVDSSGNVKTILFSKSLWTACNGIFDKEGNLWLLEYSMVNETRARKIAKADLALGRETEKQFSGNAHLLITIATGIAAFILLLLLKQVLNKSKNRLQFI